MWPYHDDRKEFNRHLLGPIPTLAVRAIEALKTETEKLGAKFIHWFNLRLFMLASRTKIGVLVKPIATP